MEGVVPSSAASLSRFSTEVGLSKYLVEIRRFPLLEPEQERMLAKRRHEQGDRAAAEKLVTSHLRLIARIATGSPAACPARCSRST
jgi:RNA polymerase sigma-32 factor